MTALSGLDSIGDYAKKAPNTIRRLVETKNFPAVKIDGVWESDTELIDSWRKCFISAKGSKEAKTRLCQALMKVYDVSEAA